MATTIPQIPKQIFSPKRAGEILDLGFNLALNLGSETLTTLTCSVSVENGTDATPDAIKVGAASIRGTWIYQRVQDGVPGVTYLLTWTATTSSGRVMQEQGYLSILP